MNNIYLLTGGNMGDRYHHLQQACKMITNSVGQVVKFSSLYETAAWGFTEQPSFLNQVLCISSSLEPAPLLKKLLTIEEELGRKRTFKMGPRIIDIDLLFYNDQVISTHELSLPHPSIANRRFVLTPLNEIAPDFMHPVLNKTMRELLQICPDPLEVEIYTPTF